MTDQCLCPTLGEKVKSGILSLRQLADWRIKVVPGVVSRHKPDSLRGQYKLCRCLHCYTYWEWRPVAKEGMYGGVPGEWVRVSEEYVKKNYQKE